MESKYENKTEFKNFCKKLVNDVENQKISIEEACYKIAGAIFGKLSDDSELKDIISEAGELELPIQHVQGNREERWNNLKDKIKKL